MQFESAYPLVPLVQLVEFINGDRGSNYPGPKDYEAGGVPFISATDVGEGRVLLDTVKRISRGAFERLRSGQVRRGDILLCIRGSLGKLGVVRDFEEGAIASSLVILRSKNPAVLGYLRYVLSGTAGLALLGSLDNGSVQGNISVASLKQMEVPLPPRHTIEEIGSLMGLLDDRIDLLRQTNLTLESIAQALFKSWFVDFDPVRAKQAGREPEGMDAATAALFPAEFEESALGLIPKGWSYRPADALYDVGIGKTPPRKEPQWFSDGSGEVRWASIKDMGDEETIISRTSECLTNEAMSKFNVRLVPSHTVLMSFKLTVGRLGISDGEMATNEAIAHFKARSESPPYTYLYSYLKTFNMKSLGSTSSIAEATNSKAVKALLVLDAGACTRAFHEQVRPLFDRMFATKRQWRALEELRDTLLPRLISGKLRLPEAQEQLEDAFA